jgi:hypothetical protein
LLSPPKDGLGLTDVEAVVNNSPMALSYYNNILSTVFLLPIIVLSGELSGTIRIFQGFEAKTFIIGASITVSQLVLFGLDIAN